MNRLINWIKNNWTDPVWSKVYAGLILALLSTIGFFLLSLFDQKAAINLYNKLINNQIRINYFIVLVIIIVFLSILIPVLLIEIKKYKRFKNPQFDLKKFIEGCWRLSIIKGPDIPINNDYGYDKIGYEYVTFLNGYEYYVSNKIKFIMTDIVFNEKKKELKWTKTHYPSFYKHAREKLKVEGDDKMTGFDDLGFILQYQRIRND